MRDRLRQSRRGYALVLALMVLMLAAGVMAGVCRYNMRQALAAGVAADELQRRWGELSCRSLFLNNAERILSQAEATRGQPMASLTRQFNLGGQRFTMIVSDEQAKMNVNALYAGPNLLDLGKTSTAVRSLLIAEGGGKTTVALRPIPVSPMTDKSEFAPRAFGSFGQIVRNASSAQLLAISNNLTCWGDGKINFHRASSLSLSTLFNGALDADQVERLRAFGAAVALAPVSDAIKQLKLADSQSDLLNQWMTDESDCQSLWIIVGTGQRNWYYLSVADSSPHGGVSAIHFEW